MTKNSFRKNMIEETEVTKRIAFVHHKGGTGKTTSCLNIAGWLTKMKKKVLVVDLDPQGNATTTCGIARAGLEQDVYAVLTGSLPMAEAVRNTPVKQLYIIPASLDLAGAEPYLTSLENRETILKRLCEPLRDSYDFLLFDCPPSLGLLTVNALVAADSTLIPVQCEYLALEGLNTLMHAVNLIKQNLNPALRVGGIVLTMTDFRANLSREVADEVKRFFKELVFDTAIPRNIRLAESPSFGKPICLYDPHSTGALAYQLLTQEVISKECTK